MTVLGVFGSICVFIPVVAAVAWDRYHSRVQ